MVVLRKTYALPAYEKPLFSRQELFKVNLLLGAAITSRSICHRLIHQRDASLQTEFNLSAETWQYLALIKASSLEELCLVLQQMPGGNC